MNKKQVKTPGSGQRRCGACDGKGVIVCRRCQGAKTEKDWKHQVTKCLGCGGTGQQACVVCRQMGVLPRK